MYDATLRSIKPTSISASFPIPLSAQSRVYGQPAAPPDATALIDGNHESSWTYSSACAGCVLRLPVVLTVYLPAGSVATHYEMLTAGGSPADTDPISWTVSTGIAGGIPRDLIPLSEVSGYSGAPTTGVKPLILNPPSPPHPPSTPPASPPRPVQCFRFDIPGESLRLVRHRRPIKIKLDYAGHQAGDVAIWNRRDVGGCAGAAAASPEFGGPLDEFASQTISLPAGAYGLCLATGNGQPWLDPLQRGRALQAVDTNFEWLGEEVSLMSSYEPPSPPPPMLPLLANQTAEALTGSPAFNGSNVDALQQDSNMPPLWLFWIIMGSIIVFCCCCCLCWFCCLRSRRAHKVQHRLSSVIKYARQSARTKASLFGGEASVGKPYLVVEPAGNQEHTLHEVQIAFMESVAELQARGRSKADVHTRTDLPYAEQRVASGAPLVIYDDFALSSDDEGSDENAADSVAVQQQWLTAVEQHITQTNVLHPTTPAPIPPSPTTSTPVPSALPLAQPLHDNPVRAAVSKAISPIVRRSQTTKQFLDDSKKATTMGLGV